MRDRQPLKLWTKNALPYNHYQDFRSINCTISNRGYIPSVKLHCNSKRRGTSLYFRKPVRLLHPIYITFFSSRRESFSFFPSVNSNSSIFVDEWTFNCCWSYWKKNVEKTHCHLKVMIWWGTCFQTLSKPKPFEWEKTHL